ncbi:MAG: arylsulfatase [Deltaproteobacteria bacterium]|nr:arylsulfatase [Deltaproteobacteria bacterium]
MKHCSWLKTLVGCGLAVILALAGPGFAGSARAKTDKPNILVIMGDDIGYWNLSFINRGMMGYKTPNIDRLANEGTSFTDYYGEQSCTAGRAAFITGQCPVRTGLTKVGLPGKDLGIQPEDPTLAEMLKPLGYMTGQFGKNHLGDLDKFLPTNHGFDEFYGNLYHLNAEEEPENPDYPKDPEFRKRFGPRGVIKSTADGKVVDTGPLTKKRMETVDEEFLAATVDFIERAHKAGKPFFAWFNSTRMHFYTHVKKEHRGVTGLNEYADGMVEHDAMVGELLALLDRLQIADNTIVIYTTDNGPHACEWPDAATTPFRGEKNTNWEGSFRVPAIIRWPGRVKAGVSCNEIVAALDWVPTLMAAVGEPHIKEELLKGKKLGTRTYKVHLDGYNILPLLAGEVQHSPRQEFFYFGDEGQFLGVRHGRWKFVFAEQKTPGGVSVWIDPFVYNRVPRIFDLRMDPFEKAETANVYDRWLTQHVFLIVPTQQVIGKFLRSFIEFPQRQKPASWNVQGMVQMMIKGGPKARKK